MIASIEVGKALTPEYLEKLKEVANAEENPVEYLSIDPGKANGVCGYDSRMYLVFMWTIAADDMVLFLHQFNKIKKCICEDYRVYHSKANDHINSDLETPRVIGRIESWATIKEVELIKQPAHIKPTGYKWLDEKPLPKSNKKNHQMDAHVHFMYWAIRRRYLKIEDLPKRLR